MNPAERAAAIGEQAKAQRERNRERMPNVAQLLDDMRTHFGMPAWFRLTEAGITVEWGTRVPDAWPRKK